MRRFLVCMGIAGLLAAGGCIDTTTMVFLNSDGSGHIVETTLMSGQAAAMMGGMMAGMGGNDGAEVEVSGGPVPDEDEARERAAALGEGVSLVSVKEMSRPDGANGARVTYKFDDITKLKLTLDNMDQGDDSGDEPDDEKEPITFGFSSGKLTINLPHPEATEEPEAEPEATAGDEMGDEMAAAMMQGMLPMLKGMRMRLFIRMPAPIKRTNASYVDVSKKNGEKRYVTLADFDMDKLIASQGGMKKLMAMQGNDDFAATAKLMSAIPGIRVEEQETLTVEF